MAEESRYDVRERGVFHRFQFTVQGSTEAQCDEAARAKMIMVLTSPDEWTVTSKLLTEESVQAQSGQSVVTVLTADYIVMRLAGDVPWLT